MEDTAKQEILEAINASSSATQEQFDDLRNEMNQRFEKIEKTIANLPDKAYLDDKLADLKGDLVLMMRKGDERAVKLIGKLRDKAVFTDIEANGLLAITPFPQA